MIKAYVDIPSKSLNKLGRIAKKRNISSSSLICLAIEEWLTKQATKEQREAFGILKTRNIHDGITIQRKLRSDW